MLTVFFLTLFFFILIFLMMAIGVFFSNKPLTKKCGYTPEDKECPICHKKADESCLDKEESTNDA